MSTSLLSTVEHDRITWAGKTLDCVELTKPKIMSMVLVTVVVAGFVAAQGQPSLLLLLHTIIGTALVAGSGSVFNQWLERDLDAKMDRTANRPIPSGRITPTEAASLGIFLGIGGIAYLAVWTNNQAACWAGLTWLLYVVVYTPLKQITGWNTAVGAVPGALPMIIAWVGVGETLNSTAWLLFLILFIWQFPHFMAIAWLYREQYSSAGYRMLSKNDQRGLYSGTLAVCGSVAIAVVTSMLFRHNLGSMAFGLSIVLALLQIACSVSFFRSANDVTARRLLRASLIYLPLQLGIFTVFFSTSF